MLIHLPKYYCRVQQVFRFQYLEEFLQDQILRDFPFSWYINFHKIFFASFKIPFWLVISISSSVIILGIILLE